MTQKDEIRSLINEIFRRHDHPQDAHDLDVELLAKHFVSKDEILKARPAGHPNTDTPDENLNAQESGEVMGYNQALSDWSKALGIGETE